MWELVSALPSGSGAPPLCTSAHLLEMPLDTKTKGGSRQAHIRVFAHSSSLHSWLLCAWNAHLKPYLRSRIP